MAAFPLQLLKGNYINVVQASWKLDRFDQFLPYDLSKREIDAFHFVTD